MTQDCIEIYGAREHNLKNIDLTLPRNALVVFTGLSGSGKSSLAFDTIFAEGQRRYMETFASYARQYIGDMKRPNVEKIDGLSPVIAIEQKTLSKNPRSTVGTSTEIYDFLRLLFARVSDAYSHLSGEKMVQYTEDQLLKTILQKHQGKKIWLLAPKIKARKGHYRELLEFYRKAAYTKMRIDGQITELIPNMQLSRYSVHDIELLVDKISIKPENQKRLQASVQTALKEGKGTLLLLEENSQQEFFYSKNLMCPVTGISYDAPQPNTFSFNSPYGACPACNGSGKQYKIDKESIIPDPSKSISEEAFVLLDLINDHMTNAVFRALAKKHKFDFNTPVSAFPEKAIHEILYGSDETLTLGQDYYQYEIRFPGLIKRFHDILENRDAIYTIDLFEEAIPLISCPECQGYRLKSNAYNFKINGSHIGELATMQMNHLAAWLKKVSVLLEGQKKIIAEELIKELRKRVAVLLELGLEYLHLNRPLYTLSGGESQRIRLATQLGSQLVNVLYIIDEPSIGLHQRDNHRLIQALKNLSRSGNTVLVVEHDKEMILSADHIVDLGPGAGMQGGQVMFSGPLKEVSGNGSITLDYLKGKKSIPLPEKRRKTHARFIEIQGARGNNLKNIHVKFPLGNLVCITGVSGSGKSSLINDTICPVIKNHLYRSRRKALAYDTITGLEYIDKVIEIDQSPIGRTPRSNPATYTGLFTPIRTLFSQLPEARIRAYKPGRFSFNIKGGRCEECQGAGLKKVEMNFLPDVYIGCPACRGKRYNQETLEVRYKGSSITDILDMTINKAYDHFENIPQIKRKLKTLKDVGMGYVKLGQSSTTLSGGEAQRIKLASELSKRDTGKTLYILDEPTTGLHFEDIHILLKVLNKLVDRGNTILIIEHNMDVIKQADYIIDLGPEGGDQGGYIIAQGSPEKLVMNEKSHTGRFLKMELADYTK
jgi:excinuclease ABC subunit A